MMPESIIINFVCICFAVHVCKVVGREGGVDWLRGAYNGVKSRLLGQIMRYQQADINVFNLSVVKSYLLIMHYFLFHLCLISCNLQIRCTGEGIQCLYQYMNYTFECGLIVQCTNFAIKWERLICVGVLCGGFCPH